MTDEVVGEVRDGAKFVEEHPAAAGVAAVGHVVNGIVHAIIGAIAIGIAEGGGGSADQSGAMRAIDAHPLGNIALWFVGFALLGLAIYSVVLAIGESRHDKSDAAKNAGRALMYAVVGAGALTYATGGTSDGEETTESLSSQLLQSWWGSALLVLAGLVILAIGVAMIYRGATKKFLEDVRMPPKFRTIFTWLGVSGYIAKGVAVAVVGILFVVAVFTRDASDTGGLDGALKSLVELPYGQPLLFAIAIGLILYGFFCLAKARMAWLNTKAN